MDTVSADTQPSPAAIPAEQAPVRGYRPELDVVRFLAFLLVFLHHILPHNPLAYAGAPFSNWMGKTGWDIAIALRNMCGMGLCLFFCLSAYLITQLLLKERAASNTVSIRKFYIRRALRIWPLYFFGILIGVAWALAHHQRQDAAGFVWYLLFAGNIYNALFGWNDNPMAILWSISVEEQFYLIWPWAMRWFSRRGLLLCALGFIAIANITLFYYGHRLAQVHADVWPNTFVQFEMFAAGILLALAKKPVAVHNAAAGAALVFLGPVLWFLACYAFQIRLEIVTGWAASGPALALGYALVALGCAAVLQGFCVIGPAGMPGWATNLGKISYGLYVYHYLILQLIIKLSMRVHFGQYRIVTGAVALALTIVVAQLSYRWFESPFLRLKRRFEILHTRPI